MPVEIAAERAGCSASSVRGWLRKGQREPDSELGRWAASLDGCDDAAEAPMTREELETILTALIREKRSVTAAKLWLELQREQPAEVDVWSEFEHGQS